MARTLRAAPSRGCSERADGRAGSRVRPPLIGCTFAKTGGYPGFRRRHGCRPITVRNVLDRDTGPSESRILSRLRELWNQLMFGIFNLYMKKK